MKTQLFILALLLSFVCTFSRASHVVGIRITYEYTGSATIFKLKMYRDCSGIPAPQAANICFTSASGCAPSFTASLTMTSNSGFQVPFNSCAGTGLTFCNGGTIFAFEEYNYESVVTVPPCSDWVVSFSECCRNAAITNLVDPDFYSGSVQTSFNNLDYPTNSSPQFNAVPVNYYCAGIPTVIDYSAYDVDGDSLSYEFTPIEGGSCGTSNIISFMPPYTYDQPLGTLVPTVFDPIGGQIVFTPSTIQISVIGFKVNEYRNGALIGSVRRDDEVVVVGGFVNPDTIAGRVYYDMNANAIFDGGDIPTSNVIVKMGTGNMYAATATSGKYDFQTGAGNFPVTIPNPPLYVTMVPASYTIATSGNGVFYGNNDFALQPTPNINDLEVTINNMVNPTPGLSYPITINYFNNGTTVQNNISVIATLDPSLSFVSSTPAPTNIAGNVITWNFSTIGLFSNGFINIITMVDTAAIMGNTVTCSVIISSPAVDQTPTNNSDTFSDIVAAPYDPNSKEVIPAGDLSLAFVTSQQWIYYKINFQNLGTALAQTVRIADMIDFDLDPGTLELSASSRPCVMTLQSPNQLSFSFFGINLPPASLNEPASHGFVEYRIKPKNTLTPGTFITNNANITFDFNSPIYTNLVHNMVVVSTGISQVGSSDIDLVAYPNPANDMVTVEFSSAHSGEGNLILTNTLGKKLLDQNISITSGSNLYTIPLKNISNGVYFLTLKQDNGTGNLKIVIQ